ncbi:MAG: metalloregulator ArsR/SmtB family transcription factor [Alphaproteobacteria bacterium]|nr:metalloregulator ArsR/SmtB family transcription factor [Alphaproteobacteria bacterium]
MTVNIETAAHRLSELGHPTRLKIIRELVRHGTEGVPVKYLQDCLEIPASTLSHHLRQLKAADLVAQNRAGTSLYCCAEFQNIRDLADFLTEECCAEVEPVRQRASRPANDA